MCGVAGVIQTGPGPDREQDVIAMLDCQATRGPDYRGLARREARGLESFFGHDRLAIIDLSPAGNQPQGSADDRLWVTYNGEIYNYIELRAELEQLGHRFRTHSDTEVLLEAWSRHGEGALDRCNGMFAFALHDLRDGTCTLVRDRFGVKPLYYAVHEGRLYFASTPGAVARRTGARPSAEYVGRGLATSLFDDRGSASPFEGVLAVPPGHLVRVSRNGERVQCDVRRWYDLEQRVAEQREGFANVTAPAAIEQVGALVEHAVRLRLRADVGIGISLSGGLDSSSLSAIAAPLGRIKGFSFGTPAEPMSEGPLVAELAERVGIGVQFVPSASGQVLKDLFDATLQAQDAPFPSASIVAQYAVFKAARADGVTVMLGGQGGDEAFMGYHKFKLFYARALAHRGSWVPAVRELVRGLRAIGESGTSARLWRRQAGRYVGRGGRSTLFGPLPAHSLPPLGYAAGTELWRRQALDVTDLSLPTLLRYEDRNSMGNSIESRLPFVDYRVVELGLALPESLKIRAGTGKWVLREAMRDRIPESIRAARAKRGFDADQPYAIGSGLGAHLRARVDGVLSRVGPWLSRPIVLDRDLSDARLSHEPVTFLEATTLIWLGELSSQ